MQVVAIFTLLPPQSKLQVRAAPLPLWQKWATWVGGLVQTVVGRLKSWSCVRWGWTVPLRMNHWIQCLRCALDVAKATDIYSSRQHDLQTMCVAKHLQGQGVGSLVLKKIQAELEHMDGAVGMQGLCQSESTRNFYVKSGFQAREVFTHTTALSKPGTLRKHWFIAWGASHKNTHEEKASNAEYSTAY
jgi:GNAT superfamily N-acetyltransferase